MYRGENVVNHFLDNLQDEIDIIRNKLIDPHIMIISRRKQEAFNSATDCYICDNLHNDDKVRNYCHVSEKYRGAAHNEYNLKLRIYPDKIKLPVVFHNLRGYDGHLIISAIGQIEKSKNNLYSK